MPLYCSPYLVLKYLETATISQKKTSALVQIAAQQISLTKSRLNDIINGDLRKFLFFEKLSVFTFYAFIFAIFYNSQNSFR